MQNYRFMSKYFLWAICTLLLLGRLYGQVPDPAVAASAPVPGSGHNYIGRGAETVNPSDGSLTFDLPINPSAGRGLSMTFGIRYSSNEQFFPSNTFGTTTINNIMTWHSYWDEGLAPTQYYAWSYDLPQIVYQKIPFIQYSVPTDGCPNGVCGNFTTYECNAYTDYVFRGLDGQQILLPVGSTTSGNSASDQLCSSIVQTYTVGNAHGILTSISGTPTTTGFTVIDKSGITYTLSNLADTIIDRNGNNIIRNGNNYVDSTGRTAVSWSGIGDIANGDTVTVAGINGNVNIYWTKATATFPENYYQIAQNNSPTTCTINQEADTNSLGSGSSIQVPEIREIDIPGTTGTGIQSYVFDYSNANVSSGYLGDNPFGNIRKITFPDGGYVRYVWGLNSNSQYAFSTWQASTVNGDGQATQTPEMCVLYYDTPAITKRYVSYDGVTEVLEQDFSYNTKWDTGWSWDTKTTTVKTIDNVTGQVTNTLYTYVPVTPDAPAYSGSTHASQVPVESSVLYQDGNGKSYKEVIKTWWTPNLMQAEQTILYDSNGNASVGSAVASCFDTNEMAINEYEYGFQTDTSKASISDSCTIPGTNTKFSASKGLIPAYLGPIKRQTISAYSSDFSYSSSTAPATWSGTHIVDAPSIVTTTDGLNNTVASVQYGYDDTAKPDTSGAIKLDKIPPAQYPAQLRKNIISVTRMISSSTNATTTYSYWDTGQVHTKTDPCGNQLCKDKASGDTTTYSYTDNYCSGTPSGQTFANLTNITDSKGYSNVLAWYYSNGQLCSTTGPNGDTTSYVYSDPLARLTQITYPDTSITSATYNDAAYNSSNATPQITTSGTHLNKTVISARDGMGHTLQSQLTTDPSGNDYTNTLYDGNGRVYKVSNPTRCASNTGTLPSSCSEESTWGYTTITYDAIGRKLLQKNQDGTTESWQYSGPTTTFTNENGNSWTQTVDGLGRLISVTEPGSLSTYYTYDTLNNLIAVSQIGDPSKEVPRNRTFTYDALSRLVCASNPEASSSASVLCPSSYSNSYTSGTTGYTYDANGNVTTKEDARGVITTYVYDALNRVLSKSYSDSVTPSACYLYDLGANAIGHLSYSWTNPAGVTCQSISSTTVPSAGYLTMHAFAYDLMGRVTSDLQSTPMSVTNSSTYPMTYTYDLAGNLTSYSAGAKPASMTLIAPESPCAGAPSFSTTTLSFINCYDTANRLISVTSNSGSGPNAIFSNAVYTPFGSIANSIYGASAISIQKSYDKRLRITSETDTGQSHSATNGATSVTIVGGEKSQ